MSSTVEQVKAKLNIVDFVSDYLKLEKAGTNWKARCPFHNEKTPSFFVSPARQTWHCFGCNRGGDLISFAEEIEGLEFLPALKMLAERVGVPLESSHVRKDNTEKENLYRLLEVARDYYVEQLSDQIAAREYLISRGLKPETMKSFALGFAPAGWQSLTSFLSGRRFSEDIMLKSGLVLRSEKNGSIYDRFRSRIMFPLSDSAGRVVGFSGRIFGEDDGSGSVGGKYVNTPETILYHKSDILYAYDRAKLAIRRAGHCIVVEGQLDLLLSHQSGFLQTVAVSGTALTNEHLTLIKRLTDKIVMAFDGDKAGLAAASRSISLALAAGFEVKLVALPKGHDPADIIVKDEKIWSDLLNGAKPVIDFLLDTMTTSAKDKLDLIHKIEQDVYPYLVSLPNAHDREYYLSRVSLLTQLSENIIREKLYSIKKMESKIGGKVATTETRTDRILTQLFGLWWQGQDLKERLRNILGEKRFNETMAKLELKKNELVLTMELGYAGMASDKLEQEIQELFSNLQIDLWQEEIEKLRFKLSREPEQEDTILKELQKIYQKISDLKK
ncbi:DNA primase [Candidatus Nomurabacteria bacterium]|nr:DNA primase [Candidatus Nomurabacteria bacterium]